MDFYHQFDCRFICDFYYTHGFGWLLNLVEHTGTGFIFVFSLSVRPNTELSDLKMVDIFSCAIVKLSVSNRELTCLQQNTEPN